eukprot:NODE_15_length_42055_cov_0.634117.p16 type:complete len:257 gc:universal NODE_15_length_42055_cov_0.634117:4875-4105(-)
MNLFVVQATSVASSIMLYLLFLMGFPIAYSPSQFYYVWTIYTNALVDDQWYVFSLYLTVHVACLSYFVKRWGLKEFCNFFVIICTTTVTIFTIYIILKSLVLMNMEYANSRLEGLQGLCIAYLVAFKQLIPEHMIRIGNVNIIRFKHTAGVYLLVHSAFCIFLMSFSCFLTGVVGFLTAWVYLRYFKVYVLGRTYIKGDRSATFALSTFFPAQIRGWVITPSIFVDQFMERIFGKKKIVVYEQSKSIEKQRYFELN